MDSTASEAGIEKIKIILLGDCNVGKTSLLRRFFDDVFHDSTRVSTLMIDFRILVRTIEGKKFKLQVWDTAGQERYQTITKTYIRGAHGVVLVYDSTNIESFKRIEQWVREIMAVVTDEACPYMPVLCLVANKSDIVASHSIQPTPTSASASTSTPTQTPTPSADADTQATPLSSASSSSLVEPTKQGPQQHHPHTTSTTTTTINEPQQPQQPQQLHQDQQPQQPQPELSPLLFVDPNVAIAYAKRYKMSFFVASAKTGQNVKELFFETSDRIVADRKLQQSLASANVVSRQNRRISLDIQMLATQGKSQSQANTTSCVCGSASQNTHLT